ncbi:MAG: septal ring lytic transglycosylase RlpA family protein [Chitinophagaceae bacterium]|nr:septal ring lytic transglycosylase RlpA family protein [Chitinophagaceae bacterium]
MKIFLYLIGALYFLLPVGKPLTPMGALLTDTISVRDTIPSLKQGVDSIAFYKDTIPVPVKELDLLGDSLIPQGKLIKGTASYYSKKFEGKKTATGTVFRNAGMTGASNHFKLNTLVLVTNLRNNKSVIVLITDRMHNRMKKRGRVIDLTRNAAKQLDFIQKGLVKVSVQPIVPIAKN